MEGFSKSEQTDHFIALFNKKRNDIENNICKADQLSDKDKMAAHFDRVNEEFHKLQKYLADSTVFLPFYNVRTAQEALKRLQELIFVMQDKLMPKKKFAFKKKTANPEKLSVEVEDRVDSLVKIKTDWAKEIYGPTCQSGFSDLTGQQLEMSSSEVNGKDIELSNLHDCSISIYGAPSTIHMSNCRSCRVSSGPVSTSVFMENCQGCVYRLACQQLRVHSTTDCHFYLHVTSRAIIEDSTSLAFAPFNWTYEGLETHYEMAGLDKSKNNWDSVDDFNWLSADTPSPNWSVLKEGEREKN